MTIKTTGGVTRGSFVQFNNSTTTKFLRDGRKKIDKFDRNRAEIELFLHGNIDFWGDKPSGKFDKPPGDK
jgi:hypothetical protein